MQPNSVLSINAVSAHPLEDFSADAVRSSIAEAQKNVSSPDELLSAEAKIELEVRGPHPTCLSPSSQHHLCTAYDCDGC